MNSFALLQDDVEDAPELSMNDASEEAAPTKSIPVPSKPEETSAVAATDAPANPTTQGDQAAESTTDPEKTAEATENEPKPPPQKDITLEEYLVEKAAMSSGLASLNLRGLRKPNDGVGGFEKMSILKKDNSPDDNSIMQSVAVKSHQETKAAKDSTQAAVARNAEMQKFFKPEASDRRRGGAYRRGYGERRGSRGRHEFRGERGRGGRGGGYRGGYRGGYGRRFDDDGDDNRWTNGSKDTEVVPNVDDTAAFPSL